MTLSLKGLQSESQKQVSEKPSEPTWPNWSNQTAVVFACGPSLSVEQIETVRSHAQFGAKAIRTIAICDAGLATRFDPTTKTRVPNPVSAPWADVLYAADRAWWQFHDPIEFDGLKVGPDVDKDIRKYVDMTVTVESNGEDWRTEKGVVAHGAHSGYQAINLAGMLGANTIVLLGYDCRKVGGTKHFYGDHPDGLRRESPYPQWVMSYQKMAGTLKRTPDAPVIYNCTPDSAIQAFPMRELHEVL